MAGMGEIIGFTQSHAVTQFILQWRHITAMAYQIISN